MAGGKTFARRENMNSALLVKEDFVLITAGNKSPPVQLSIARRGAAVGPIEPNRHMRGRRA
jgi:hypothetical protein